MADDNDDIEAPAGDDTEAVEDLEPAEEDSAEVKGGYFKVTD